MRGRGLGVRRGAGFKRGLCGSKGDTEGPRVSLPNHCVALQGGEKGEVVVVVEGEEGSRTKKRERWKKRRRGGEQTDKHRRPTGKTRIRVQTSTFHTDTTIVLSQIHSLLHVWLRRHDIWNAAVYFLSGFSWRRFTLALRLKLGIY